MRTPANLAQHELMGLAVEVAGSADRKQKGVRGTVVDETKNMLAVELADGRVVHIAKIGRTFRFNVGGAKCEMDGSKIAFDPVERVKRCAGVKVRVQGKKMQRK
ncbi:MAG: ribonuclease P protein subunit [Candidatus Burarchaeum sp.]|nr:ribonuclease P protein subunit [Candidatus Burarchaeum sp.]MDO8339367.1 ribonuclease P protein subunit [Candidatus Burarchaeum sp.]